MLFACFIKVRLFTFLKEPLRLGKGQRILRGELTDNILENKGAVKITEGRMQVLINYSRICNIYW